MRLVNGLKVKAGPEFSYSSRMVMDPTLVFSLQWTLGSARLIDFELS